MQTKYLTSHGGCSINILYIPYWSILSALPPFNKLQWWLAEALWEIFHCWPPHPPFLRVRLIYSLEPIKSSFRICYFSCPILELQSPVIYTPYSALVEQFEHFQVCNHWFIDKWKTFSIDYILTRFYAAGQICLKTSESSRTHLLRAKTRTIHFVIWGNKELPTRLSLIFQIY